MTVSKAHLLYTMMRVSRTLTSSILEFYVIDKERDETHRMVSKMREQAWLLLSESGCNIETASDDKITITFPH